MLKKHNFRNYMKLFSIILILILVGCNEPTESKFALEIMSYNYERQDSQLKINPHFFAISDQNGTVNSIVEKDSSKVIFNESQISKSTIRQIQDKINQHDKSHFTTKLEDISLECYLGLNIRFRLSDNSGKQTSFSFRDINYPSNSDYYIFKKLYDEIKTDPKVRKAPSSEINALIEKREVFKIYTLRRDTIELQCRQLLRLQKLMKLYL